MATNRSCCNCVSGSFSYLCELTTGRLSCLNGSKWLAGPKIWAFPDLLTLHINRLDRYPEALDDYLD